MTPKRTAENKTAHTPPPPIAQSRTGKTYLMILTDITCLFWHHLKTVWNAGLVLLLIAIDCKSGIKTKSTIQGKTRAEEEQLGMIFSFQWRRYFWCEGITIFLTPLFHLLLMLFHCLRRYEMVLADCNLLSDTQTDNLYDYPAVWVRVIFRLVCSENKLRATTVNVKGKAKF